MAEIPTNRICLDEKRSGTKSCLPTSFGARREESNKDSPETMNNIPMKRSIERGIPGNFSLLTEARN
jgi:hypothetical protein